MLKTNLSRSCKRRIQRRIHVQRDVAETVLGVNQLYNFDSGGEKGADSYISSAQSRSLEFIKGCVQELGSPGSVDGSGALAALRVSDGYGGMPVPSALGSFDPELVSLPSGEVQPVSLSSLIGENGQNAVEEFIRSHVRSSGEAATHLQVEGPDQTYSDPKFRNKATYAGFVKRLHVLGLLEIRDYPGHEEVGLFFVKKKNDKLRMILDCRRSNHWFSEPEPVKLTTGESLRRIQVPPDEKLYVCNADLANAFYTLSMPEEIRDYFCLKPVCARDLGLTEIGKKPVKPGQKVFPRLAVLPMGWTWALYWCQRAHEAVVERSGLKSEERLQDFSPVPRGNFWHVQYVDNLHVMGTDKSVVQSRFWKAVRELQRCGLTVHEEEECEDGAKVLGWEYEIDGTFRPSRSRVWRVRMAIKEVLRRGRMSGVQLEQLLGHLTFISLGKREVLSIFGDSYTFVKRHYHDIAPIWKSVRKELLTWCRVSPLIVQDLRSEWSSEISAVDASEWGLGVTSTVVEVAEVEKVGRYNERWRFKDPSTSKPRSFVAKEDEKTEIVYLDEDAPEPPSKSTSFEAVPFEFIKTKWQVVGRHQWQRLEPMPVLEARASLFAVRRLMRKVDNLGKRHLILTDSLTAACAFSKGRSQSHRMRTVVQRVSALLLAGGSSLVCRWLPSEWNPADSPSRGGWKPSELVRKLDGDLPQLERESQLAEQGQADAEESNKTEQENNRTFGEGFAKKGSTSDMGHRNGREERPPKKTTAGNQKAESGQGRKGHGNATVILSHQCNFEQVQRTPQFVQTMDAESWSKNDQDTAQEDGHGDESIPGRAVQEGGGPFDGQLRPGCLDLFPPSVERKGDDALEPSRTPGVEAFVSPKKSDACALRSRGPSFGGGSGTRFVGGGNRDAAKLLFIPTSCRIPTTSSVRHSQASPTFTPSTSVLGGTSEPYRVGSTFKNKPMGRGTELGPEDSCASGSCYEQSASSSKPTKARLGLQCEVNRSEQLHDGGVGGSRTEGAREAPPIPPPTRRCYSRDCQQVEANNRSTTQRSMAVNPLIEKLREGRTVSPAFRPTGQNSTTAVHKGSRQSALKAPQPALSVPRALRFQVFLEIFSGSGRLGRAVMKHCSLPVLLWDITYGTDYDLCVRKNQWKILEWIRCGAIAAGHLGTPCNSFSRARDQPGGPPPLRSDSKPLGLEGLRPGDEAKVRIGNVLMRFSVRIMLLALMLGLPFTLENPRRSRLWICPPMLALLRRRNVSTVFVDFCMFNKPWKKPTTFAGVHVSFTRLQSYRCIGSKRGICLHSGKPHLPLSGQTSSREWLTKIAEPYPTGLCNGLAKVFLDAQLQLVARNFGSHIGIPF